MLSLHWTEADGLLQAIDTDRKGYIEEERLRELLTGTDTTYFRAKEISCAF